MKNYIDRKKDKKKSKIAGAAAILHGCPYIQIIDGTEITVEGCCRILEYTDDVLCVMCGKKKITVSGKNIDVRLMDSFAMVACGAIHSVSFGE